MKRFVLCELLRRSAVSLKRFRSLFRQELRPVFLKELTALRSAGGIRRHADDLAVISPTPRKVFLAALHFIDRAELEGMSEVRFSLSSARGKWDFKLLSLAPAQACLSQARGLALVLAGDRSPLISARADERLLELMTAGFAKAAARGRAPSAAGIAPYFLNTLQSLLSRLEQAGRLRPGSLRLAREAVPD